MAEEVDTTDEKQKVYEINGRRFYQAPLVLGQMRWLIKRLKKYQVFDLTPEQMVEILGEEVSGVMAIVLVEEGQTVAAKVEAGYAKVAELEAWFDANAGPELAIPVLTDFFVSGQVPRLVEVMKPFLPADLSTRLKSTNSSSS